LNKIYRSRNHDDSAITELVNDCDSDMAEEIVKDSEHSSSSNSIEEDKIVPTQPPVQRQ
jgi:hypothetical protein